jgi:hypothetical protein
MATEPPRGIALATVAVQATVAPEAAETRPARRAEHRARIAELRDAPARSRCGLGLAIALAGALIVGCGTSGPATAVPSGGPASPAPASPAPSGSFAPGTPRPAGAYSLTMPTGWRSVRIGSDYASTATTYDALSLRFASSLMSQLTGLPKSASTYAFDGSDATVRSGTLVALTVTEVALPATVNLDAFSAEVGRQASLVAETTVPAERIETASGPADQFVYQASFAATSAGTPVAAITQVLLVVPSRGYVLTFSTTPSRAPADGPVFAKIARSIVLTP